jgi:hypothetical protein
MYKRPPPSVERQLDLPAYCLSEESYSAGGSCLTNDLTRYRLASARWAANRSDSRATIEVQRRTGNALARRDGEGLGEAGDTSQCTVPCLSQDLGYESDSVSDADSPTVGAVWCSPSHRLSTAYTCARKGRGREWVTSSSSPSQWRSNCTMAWARQVFTRRCSVRSCPSGY